MNKQELLENYTAEQLAEMVVSKQNIIDDMKSNIDYLNDCIERKETIINQIDDILNELFGVTHDIAKPNEFKEILKEKIEIGKTIADFLPTEPIKVADMLINASKKRTNCMTNKEYDKYIFEKWQLRQIAKHLLVYCNANEREIEERKY